MTFLLYKYNGAQIKLIVHILELDIKTFCLAKIIVLLFEGALYCNLYCFYKLKYTFLVPCTFSIGAIFGLYYKRYEWAAQWMGGWEGESIQSIYFWPLHSRFTELIQRSVVSWNFYQRPFGNPHHCVSRPHLPDKATSWHTYLSREFQGIPEG